VRERAADIRQALHTALATARERRALHRRFPGARFEEGARVIAPERLRLGANVVLQRGALVHCGGGAWAGGAGEVVLGDETMIGHNAVLYGAGTIVAGARFHAGPGSMVLSHTEKLAGRLVAGDPVTADLAPVHIGDDVTLFAGAIVTPGVTIGTGAAIGAGAVVTHDVPPWELHAGVPARRLRDLPQP
jgi:acetyltransferase-like isoleucine patch superfamily enzyme